MNFDYRLSFCRHFLGRMLKWLSYRAGHIFMKTARYHTKTQHESDSSHHILWTCSAWHLDESRDSSQLPSQFIIILYFENVAFFHAKLGLDICPRVDNQTSGETLQDLIQPLSEKRHQPVIHPWVSEQVFNGGMPFHTNQLGLEKSSWISTSATYLPTRVVNVSFLLTSSMQQQTMQPIFHDFYSDLECSGFRSSIQPFQRWRELHGQLPGRHEFFHLYRSSHQETVQLLEQEKNNFGCNRVIEYVLK